MNKLLIEVGAYDGKDGLAFYNNGYEVYTFEPKKDLFEDLYERKKHLNNYTVIEKAVCLSDGKTTFNICKSGGASSILPFKSDNELFQTWPGRPDVLYSGESYDVDTIRLDTFIEENGLQYRTIDYIHVDAQGVDLDVLQSLGKYIGNVKEGVIETVIYEEKIIYVDENNNNVLKNVETFLKENNFEITNVKSNDGQNCEFNVYFRSLNM
jgi:hypothetical protein